MLVMLSPGCDLRLGSVTAFAARLFALAPTFSADEGDPLTAMRRVGFERVSKAVEQLDSTDALRTVLNS